MKGQGTGIQLLNRPSFIRRCDRFVVNTDRLGDDLEGDGFRTVQNVGRNFVPFVLKEIRPFLYDPLS